MEKFLQLVCKELISRYSYNDLSELTVILPGRRPEFYFYRALSEHFDKPHLAPKIVTLFELVQSFSRWDAANDIELIFRLFIAYRKRMQFEQDFNAFYFWGEMLLRDFNDVDMALADPELVFRNIFEAKRIDELFHNPEIARIVNRFHGAYTKMISQENNLSHKVIRFWENLFSIYSEFNTDLERENIGYKGKIFRDVCSRQRDLEELLANKKFAVVGFEMFQTAEKKFLQMLKDNAETLFFWDYDSFYLDPDFVTSQELQRLLIEFPPAIDLKQKNYFNQTQKEINLCYAPGNLASLSLAAKMAEDSQNQNTLPDVTAVLIPDHTFIVPLLKSFSNQNQLNLTAGYPLNQSRIAAFLLMVIELWATSKDNNNQVKTELLQKILSTTWFDKAIAKRMITELQNSFFISSNEILSKFKSLLTSNETQLINSYDLLTLILSSDKSSIFDRMVKVIEQLQQVLEKEQRERLEQQIDLEHLACEELKTKFHQIFNVEGRFNSLMDRLTQLRFARQVIHNSKIPLEGSPLRGIQILSFSETAIVDFEHVIIPCANEGIIPKIATFNSHIPFAIRKAFGLSTLFDDEVRQAYLFYRLIQRAKKITFIVNSSENQIDNPDASRYIKQLDYYFSSSWHWQKNESTFSLNVSLPNDLSITWDKKVHDYMNQYLKHESFREVKKISPSAINTYLQCSLKFYFKYPCGLKEPEVVNGIIKPSDFGNLLHKTLQTIYNDFIGRQVTAKDINTMLPQIQEIVEQKYNQLPVNKESGYNQILKELVALYVEKILKTDSEAPFQIINLEKNLSSPFSFEIDGKRFSVEIGGIADRIDKVDQTIRILDYKTGKIQDTDPDLKKVFAYNDEDQLKELLQTFLYRQIYLKNYPLNEGETIKVGLIITHELNKSKDKGYYFFKDFDFEANAEDFEQRLKMVLSDMFNPSKAFMASSNQGVCKFCPYKEICGR